MKMYEIVCIVLYKIFYVMVFSLGEKCGFKYFVYLYVLLNWILKYCNFFLFFFIICFDKKFIFFGKSYSLLI